MFRTDRHTKGGGVILCDCGIPEEVGEVHENSPKMLYSYVPSKQKNVVFVSKVCDTNGKLSENDKETAQIRKDFRFRAAVAIIPIF